MHGNAQEAMEETTIALLWMRRGDYLKALIKRDYNIKVQGFYCHHALFGYIKIQYQTLLDEN